MIIDSHAHLVPRSLLEAIGDSKREFPSVEVIKSGDSMAFSFAGNKPTRPVAGFLTDEKKRLDWMDSQGIDRQVVGGWLDMFGNDLPPAEGAAWCRLTNAHLKSAAKASGDRFIPLATVPLQDGALAAEVLREAHAQGFRGAMIGTQPKGRGGVLDAPDLDTFWRAADDLGSALFIHPVFDAGDDRVNDYGMANAVGRITDTLIAVSRLIYSGKVENFPNASFVTGIGGAALPYVIGRLRRNYSLAPDKLHNPDTALSMMYYDTLLHDPAALMLLLDTVGADRVMLGSDMPFPIGDPEPRAILEGADVDAAGRLAIESGVISKLLAL